MRKALKLFSVAVLLVFVLASCTTMRVTDLSFGEPASVQTLGTFETSVSGFKLLGSGAGTTIANIRSNAPGDTIESAVQAEIAKLGGNGAINVTVEYGADFLDLLLTGLTGSIYAPYSIKISGTVVKY
ncbi:MAG: hypothetical protein GW949_08550 [Spirochaetales bacterium]|nr:hypothetical protein [Spirochaetales bacterium]